MDMNVLPLSTAGTRSRSNYPPFGLMELGNFTASSWPKIPALVQDAAFEGHPVVFAQCYTPTVKGMENRVPLLAHPNLLTYLLGEAYVSQNARFHQVWEEVQVGNTHCTRSWRLSVPQLHLTHSWKWL